MSKTKDFMLVVAVAIMAFTFSCSSNDGEEKGVEPSSSSVEPSSSSEEPSSSSEEPSSSSEEPSSSSEEPSSSSEEPSSSSEEPSSSSEEPSSSSEEPSSSSEEPSSSSEERSSSSYEGLCADFIEGTKRLHYEKEKEQFCDERDGQKYVYVTIDTQNWMAENLNYEAEGSKCYYDNTGGDSEGNCVKYGRLYDWATAMNNVCPDGWHLPSDAEWTTLTDFVGGLPTAGTKLKATSGWSNGGNGSDDYGFSILPSGYGISDGGFSDIGEIGIWHSATEYNSGVIYSRLIGYNGNVTRYLGGHKAHFFSIRCLQEAAL